MSTPNDKSVERVLGEILAGPDAPLVPIDLLPGILSIPDRVRPRPSARMIAAATAAAACLLIAAWLAWSPAPGPVPTPPTVAERPPTVGERVWAAVNTSEPVAAGTREDLGETALVHLHRIAVDEDPVAARRAIDWIATLANPRSLPALIEAADMEDRAGRAAAALGAIGPRALPAIVPLLDRAEVFDLALAAVVSIGGPRAVDALALAIAAGEEPDRRQRLLAALGEVDGLEGTRRLLAFLPDEGRGGHVLAVLEAHRDKIVPHLIELAGSPEALRALALIAPPEAVPELCRRLAGRGTRALAARALARIDTPEAAAALLEFAGDPAVRAAARYGGPGLERTAIDRIETAAAGELTGLIALLGEAGGDDSVTTLVSLAERPALGPAVVGALSRIGTPTAIRALADLGAESRLRRPAISALGATGDALAVTELVRIGRADRGVRREACRALARIPAATAVEGILLLEREGGVGREVRRSLARMDGKLVRSTLSTLVTGDLGPEAKRALRELGVSAGPPRAVSLL